MSVGIGSPYSVPCPPGAVATVPAEIVRGFRATLRRPRQVASRIGDYLVAVLFVQATHNNLQSLTTLIGNAWLASYVVQLAVSLFVTPWILARLGDPVTLVDAEVQRDPDYQARLSARLTTARPTTDKPTGNITARMTKHLELLWTTVRPFHVPVARGR